MSYSLSIAEIIDRTGLTFDNPASIKTFQDTKVSGIWNPAEADSSQLTFVTSDTDTRARVVVARFQAKVPDGAIVLRHQSPRYAAAKIAQLWWWPRWPQELEGLPGATIYSDVEVGSNFMAWPGAVIGADGFGFEYDELTGRYFKFPHLGSVIIGDDVEIQSLSNVDRGALSHTYIGDGTKIDSLVHIAHNCRIGKNVMIAACAELSGSVTVGDNTWIGPNSSIMQGITIGAGATIGIGATVLRDVNPGETVVGVHRVIESKSSQRGVIR